VSRKIGVFGGSFDPIHYGHLILAEQCREQAQLDVIVFVPAHRSPLKSYEPTASPHHRLQMVNLAIAGHDAFEVDSIELDRPPRSFTIETLRELQSRTPDHEWFLIVGSDALREFAQWREPAEIMRRATPLVVARPGEVATLEVVRPFVSESRWREIQHGRIEAPLLEISSSDLRRRVATGRSIRYMTPRAVEVYIQTHGIYRSSPAPAGD
jgi:nicotinate-nucleotide adenylyltransferase